MLSADCIVYYLYLLVLTLIMLMTIVESVFVLHTMKANEHL
jgi:hypothetical protein